MVVVGHIRRCCDTVEVPGERNRLDCEAVGCKKVGCKKVGCKKVGSKKVGSKKVGYKAAAGAQKNLDCKDIEVWIFLLVMEAQVRLMFLLG